MQFPVETESDTAFEPSLFLEINRDAVARQVRHPTSVTEPAALARFLDGRTSIPLLENSAWSGLSPILLRNYFLLFKASSRHAPLVQSVTERVYSRLSLPQRYGIAASCDKIELCSINADAAVGEFTTFAYYIPYEGIAVRASLCRLCRAEAN